MALSDLWRGITGFGRTNNKNTPSAEGAQPTAANPEVTQEQVGPVKTPEQIRAEGMPPPTTLERPTSNPPVTPESPTPQSPGGEKQG